MGPYVNPSETYNYYDLPFCQHNSMEVPKQSLGETLKGDELTRSLFDVRFKSEMLHCCRHTAYVLAAWRQHTSVHATQPCIHTHTSAPHCRRAATASSLFS